MTPVVKPGWKTSEFWIATLTAEIGIVNQAFGWDIPPGIFAGVAAIVAGYVISRGLTKIQPAAPIIVTPALLPSRISDTVK